VDPVATPSGLARRTRVLAVLLGILALALGASAWARHVGPQHRPASSTHASGQVAGERPAAGPGRAPAARPVRLEISAIRVSASITPLGLNPDRTVQVPRNPDDVGWYRLGSLPGQPGSAVILGHVDSTEGPAVFARLRLLRPGAGVEVVSSDGSATRFVVTSVATYANADFPAQKVYRSRGRPGLALVTCGGRYDAAHGGYQANVVVYAALAQGAVARRR
jgi:hypothetical protein